MAAALPMSLRSPSEPANATTIAAPATAPFTAARPEPGTRTYAIGGGTRCHTNR